MSAPDASLGVTQYRSHAHEIFRRIDRIAGQCGSHFPLYGTPSDETWKLSRRGSWLGGFWAALWWRRALVDTSSEARAMARQWTRRLTPMLQEASINRSFVFWYGAGIAAQQDCEPEWAELATRACAQLRKSYHDKFRMYPVGRGMGAGATGDGMLNIDSLASLLMLLKHHGDEGDQARARQHLDTCLSVLAGANGQWGMQASPDDIAGGSGSFRCSARGQAWAMLGLAHAVACFGDAYLHPALLACDWWICNPHRKTSAASCDRLPTAENAGTRATADPCAMAIACVALGQLWRQAKVPWLYDAARTELARLLSVTMQDSGIFAGHLYFTGLGREELVETPCSLYFLLEAVMTVAND